MLSGLCAFPLTPLNNGQVDEESFARIMARLTAAGVDSLGILGSTGSYAYLTRQQRQRVIELTRQLAGDIPLMAGIGSVSSDEILRLAEDAQQAGANAFLLSVICYQSLRDEEVYRLFETVTQQVSIPICVYDNPSTTHFRYSDQLLRQLSSLPQVRSVKIPGIPGDHGTVTQRINQLRSQLRPGTVIGISGDAFAASGLIAGCDVWYSVCGGLFPHISKQITRAAAVGDAQQVTALSARLEPLWALFRKHGSSLRVISAAAGILGLTPPDNLPRPLLPLPESDLAEIAAVIEQLELE
ncbi:dihydrodipicolinate synthase family protein [Tatumella sp. UBA2305]|uniref:dihydrodipicolinate synthase family protein n=1 Tax=Tatumella sp. UBA2305 TaxID=1947647 RepID=UPI0025ECCDB2|nr:dihydrodipicolinate synthase family protein [Tatumella sp. UBA2305]